MNMPGMACIGGMCVQKCSDRSWKQVWAVLRGHALFLIKDRREGSNVSWPEVGVIRLFQTEPHIVHKELLVWFLALICLVQVLRKLRHYRFSLQ